MVRLLTTLIGLALSVAGLAPQSVQAAQLSSCSPSFVGRAAGLLDAYLAKSKAPGVAVAFFDNGVSCLLSRGTSGGPTLRPVTAKTIFAMGSIQKVFNATLLAHAIVQGKATIDDPVAKYLVAANGARVSAGSTFWQVTLRQLVTHTASLPDAEPNPKDRSAFGLFRDRPLKPSVTAFLSAWTPPYPTGTRYSYSNFGFVLVAYAATNLAGKPYNQLLSEVITGPLGMTRTARAICDGANPLCASGNDEAGQPTGAKPVGLWTTAEDLLLFIRASLGDVRLPDLLARAVDVTHQELFRDSSGHAVGMAWEERQSGGALLLYKNGADAGFASWIAIQPNRHRGVAVLSNGAGGPPPETLGTALLTLSAN